MSGSGRGIGSRGTVNLPKLIPKDLKLEPRKRYVGAAGLRCPLVFELRTECLPTLDISLIVLVFGLFVLADRNDIIEVYTNSNAHLAQLVGR